MLRRNRTILTLNGNWNDISACMESFQLVLICRGGVTIDFQLTSSLHG